MVSATAAYLAVLGGSADAAALARHAAEVAETQEADFWHTFSLALIGATETDRSGHDRLVHLADTRPAYLSIVAEAIAPRLHAFGDRLDAIVAEVERRPERWRPALRRQVVDDRGEGRVVAARILDQVGELGDVAALRAVARANRKVSSAAGLGRGLARLRAPKVFVEDLGRVGIRCGERFTVGGAIRRKVLGLLCLVISQQGMSTTREYVMDALWPDLDPTAALNSLNQTIYFLRRVIEPKYDDDTSPGYVHHDGELIWLDAELVDSRSNQCRSLIRRLSTAASVAEVDALTEMYTGRFALDFEYEEWAAPYREWLHGAFLEIVERSITEDLRASQFDRAIRVLRTALEVDPGAEHLELLLLRAYRMSGAHAAASEQYQHYAAVLRTQLGVEPPPLDAL
jgi:DNA-binding SARP family transcriptional activator